MIKQCVRCKLMIDTSKERHIVVKDNEGKNNLKTLWYHKQCWHEVMTGKGQLNNMLQRANKLFNFTEKKFGIPEEDKTYEVVA